MAEDVDIKEGSGIIFKNKYKKNDTHPEYKGRINADGKIFDIALWVKTAKSGEIFFGAKVSDPYVKPAEEAPVPTPDQADDTPNKLPF